MTVPEAGDSPALLARFDVTTALVDVLGDQYSIVHPKDAETLIDEAAFNKDERLPYWADVWPSSVALARAVRAMDGKGKTLLELGCGVGMVAVAGLRAGFAVTGRDRRAFGHDRKCGPAGVLPLSATLPGVIAR